MDPFLDIIRLLGPRATLRGGFDAAGQWGLSFRKKDDLLFCWVQRGECLLIRPLLVPLLLQSGDFVLIRTTTPFALASDLDVIPKDIEATIAVRVNSKLQLGGGEDAPVSVRGGKFVFDTANADLLTGLLPSLIHIVAGDTSSGRVSNLLNMIEAESQQPQPGGEFITSRLMELILVEVLRSAELRVNQEHTGLLAGLADPMTRRALSAMHGDISRSWTVSDLAKVCAVSRSSLSARFGRIMHTGPIEYLQHWRIALAKDELRRGKRSISEIAFAVGFQSSSAFSTAFTREVGCSPKRFANLRLDLDPVL